jgi:aminoglycoside phosphotransferase (APT) family kinase protein
VSWRPEIAITLGHATRVIRGQFPQLERVEPLGEGWDYTAFHVDEQFVFRFPRRAVVLPGMEREIATLPRLSLPVAVPVPLFLGKPVDDYPWPFFGAPFIPGDEPLDVPDDVRETVSLDLARTLRALHAHEPADLPPDPNNRADMSRRVPWARDALAKLDIDGEHVLATAEQVGTLDGNVLCHGDLHVRQLLAGIRLNGVIDWVDVCRGNPGIDLSPLWSFVPRELFDAFLNEYGPISDESLIVARVLAIGLCATLALYARDVGNARLEGEMLAGVRRALAD